MKHEEEVIIYRNRSTVFSHLTEPEKLHRWLDDLVSATPTAELSPQAPYRQVIRIGGSETRLEGRVLDFSKDEKFSFMISTAASKITVSFELELHVSAQGAATRLKSTEEIIPISLISKLLTPLLHRLTRRKQAADLNRLKVFLDQGADIT